MNHEMNGAATGPDITTASFSLPNDATAARGARNAVRATLQRWRLFDLIDIALLAVSELATNAVRHGLPPIALSVRQRVGQVRIDVDDARPAVVAPPEEPGDLRESGRGLDIVRGVADEVGIEGIPGDGKIVYASWNVDPG